MLSGLLNSSADSYDRKCVLTQRPAAIIKPNTSNRWIELFWLRALNPAKDIKENNKVISMGIDQRQKFCIITTQRSGSTWLVKLLNNHPGIRCFDEMLLYRTPDKRRDPNMLRYFDYRQAKGGWRPWILLEYMNRFFDEYPGDYEYIGYKVMYDQLVKRPEVIYPLIKQNYKLIHLVRENFLDIVLSKKNMQKNQLAHASQEVKLDKIYLHPKNLMTELTFLDFKLRTFRAFLAMLPNHSIEISYADLCVDKNEVLAKVLDFFEVESEVVEFKSSLVKMAKGSYADKIENYRDIEQILKGTRFQYLLDDGAESGDNTIEVATQD
ncbi:sulfotransferase [Nodosilinea sp. LEGE 07088]|uniref:sulfotransferase family protein n=1 Tax=Nodosilinea sp. LEGE 07088 TaxID=2777968 RepID=UPI0018818ADB|nr:sulfotransferase [Nodosilinea sp. LEGE 07088]MBE9140104.1 sulfotransferase [Nodosilinea sp. LEGE 07088]